MDYGTQTGQMAAGQANRNIGVPIATPAQDTVNSILSECLAGMHELNGRLNQIGNSVGGLRPQDDPKTPSPDGLVGTCGELRRQVSIAHEHTARIGNSIGC